MRLADSGDSNASAEAVQPTSAPPGPRDAALTAQPTIVPARARPGLPQRELEGLAQTAPSPPNQNSTNQHGRSPSGRKGPASRPFSALPRPAAKLRPAQRATSMMIWAPSDHPISTLKRSSLTNRARHVPSSHVLSRRVVSSRVQTPRVPAHPAPTLTSPDPAVPVRQVAPVSSGQLRPPGPVPLVLAQPSPSGAKAVSRVLTPPAAANPAQAAHGPAASPPAVLRQAQPSVPSGARRARALSHPARRARPAPSRHAPRAHPITYPPKPSPIPVPPRVPTERPAPAGSPSPGPPRTGLRPRGESLASADQAKRPPAPAQNPAASKAPVTRASHPAPNAPVHFLAASASAANLVERSAASPWRQSLPKLLSFNVPLPQ